MNKDVALLYGILAGDGCISQCGKYYFISITCNIHDDIPFFDDIVIPLIEKLRKKKTVYRKREKYGKIEINFNDKKFFNFIKSLNFPVGKKKGLCISNIFSHKYYPDIIAGYFSTDGCLVLTNNNGIIYPRIEIQCVSSKILNQTKDFLNMNGMNGSVYKTTRRSGFNKGRVIYRLQYNGKDNLLKFKELIGFINPKHEEKYKRYEKRRCGSVVNGKAALIIQ